MKKNTIFIVTTLLIYASLTSHAESFFPNSFSKSELRFAQGTVGAVISSGGDHVYILKVKKGQRISLIMNSGGMRAGVSLFSPTKVEMGVVHDSEDMRSLEHVTKENGTYYIVCYSGLTAHTYDFTIRIDDF